MPLRALFYHFVVLLTLSFSGSVDAKENGIELIIERVDKLEGMLNSNAFSYDINLRSEVSESLTKQKMLLELLKLMENRLIELEKRTSNSPTPINEKELKEAIKDLREEFKLLFSTNISIQKSTIENIESSLDKNFATIKLSTDNAIASSDNIVYWVIYTFSALFVLFGAIASWKGNQISESSSEALTKVKIAASKMDNVINQAASAEEKYDGINEVVENNIIELNRITKESINIHAEINVLHEITDLRNFYNDYLTLEEKKTSYDRIIIDASKLIKRLEELNDTFSKKANLSYVASILGNLYYIKDEFEKSYEFFELSLQNNVKDRPDRHHNIACLASILYERSGGGEESYLSVGRDNYYKLSGQPFELEKLESDKDFKFIFDIIKPQ